MEVSVTKIAVVQDDSRLSGGNRGLYYIDPNGGAPPFTDVIFDNFAAGKVK